MKGIYWLGFVALMFLQACTTQTYYDYSQYRKSFPRSILVLPPKNESIEVDAPYLYLAGVSQPLAERGYYVFPVAIVDQFMKQNGLPMPEDMHGASLDKIDEIFAADAVLYITIRDWGQKYTVLSSTAVVSVAAKLIDVKSGQKLWEGERKVARSSNDGNNAGLAGMLVGAVITQVMSSVSSMDMTPQLSVQANTLLFSAPANGLLDGHYIIPE